MLYMCFMDIMNVLRTGMNMCISHIHIWLCYTFLYLTVPFDVKRCPSFVFLLFAAANIWRIIKRKLFGKMFSNIDTIWDAINSE